MNKLFNASFLPQRMISALLDSNIYGLLVADIKDGPDLVEKIKQDRDFIIHNFKLIRNELRKAPSKVLPIYDKLAANRVIGETKQIKDLANLYFKEYKSNKGTQGQKKIFNDFKIVSCATILNCDLVISEDRKTLLHPIAIQAYKDINIKISRRTPTFYNYKDLKKKYSLA